MNPQDSYWLHNPTTHQPTGPYSSQQISDFLKAGQLNGSHLVNKAGVPNWQRIAELFPEQATLVMPAHVAAAPVLASPPAPTPVAYPAAPAQHQVRSTGAVPNPYQPQIQLPQVAAAQPAIGWLICLSGPDKGTRVPVQLQEAILGRGAQSPVQLRDDDVAEQHMKFQMVGTELHYIVANGLKVLFNGQEMTQGKCREGDQLQIGDSVWVYDAPDAADWFFRKIAGSVSSIMGVDALEAFSFKTLLSDAFHRRTHEEIERHVMVGTPVTTPALADIPTFWPKPWLFYRVLLFSLGAFAVLAGTMLIFGNPKLVPALTILGAVGAPLAVTVLFFELNVPQNISIYQTLRALVLGGVLSLAITHLGLFVPFPAWLGASSAGPIEEIAKLAALILVVKGSRYPWTLNGLLFGAAVGAGFGIFETAGYAMEAGNKAGVVGMLFNTFMRGILSPGMHVAWTALVGAALWRVRQGREFNFSMLTDFRFLRILLLAIVAHMLWNSPIQLPFFGNNIIVTLALWFALLSLVQVGLNEIREAKKAASASAPPVLA